MSKYDRATLALALMGITGFIVSESLWAIILFGIWLTVTMVLFVNGVPGADDEADISGEKRCN